MTLRSSSLQTRPTPHRNPAPGLVSPELLGRIAGGDQEAMSELYDLTSTVIFRLACRVLGEEGEAEETLHDVYIYVWHRTADFNSARWTANSWLLIIARKLAMDRLRAKCSFGIRGDVLEAA